MLEIFIHNHTDGYKRLPGIQSDCALKASYNSFTFLTSSRVWREDVKYEIQHHVGKDKAEFVGWYNREFFIIFCEERAKLYGKVPCWLRKYEP